MLAPDRLETFREFASRVPGELYVRRLWNRSRLTGRRPWLCGYSSPVRASASAAASRAFELCWTQKPTPAASTRMPASTPRISAAFWDAHSAIRSPEASSSRRVVRSRIGLLPRHASILRFRSRGPAPGPVGYRPDRVRAAARSPYRESGHRCGRRSVSETTGSSRSFETSAGSLTQDSRGSGRPSPLPAPCDDVAAGSSNRSALEAEALPQPVLQESHIGGLDRLRIRTEDDDRRRAHADLGGVEELVWAPIRALARHRRRMFLGHVAEASDSGRPSRCAAPPPTRPSGAA